MLSAQIYLVGCTALLLLALLLSHHLLANYPLRTVRELPSRCLPTQPALCVHCLTPADLPPLSYLTYRIASPRNFHYATLQSSALTCNEILQIIDPQRLTQQDSIRIVPIPSVLELAKELAFTSPPGWREWAEVPADFAQLVVVQQEEAKVEVSSANRTANDALMSILQALSIVALGFATIVAGLYRQEKTWVNACLSYLPGVVLLLILAFCHPGSYKNPMLLAPLAAFYLHAGHTLALPTVPLILLCLLLVTVRLPAADLPLQLLLVALCAFYNFRSLGATKALLLVCGSALMLNSYWLRVELSGELGIRGSLLQTMVVTFVPSLCELQRAVSAGAQRRKGAVKLGELQLQEGALTILE